MMLTIKSGKREGRVIWLDDKRDDIIIDKDKLMTNDPALDLIHKEEGECKPVTNHYKVNNEKGILKIKLAEIVNENVKE